LKFNRRARLDPSQVLDVRLHGQRRSDQPPSGRRRRPRGTSVAGGVGIGAILVSVLAWLTGAGPFDPLDSDAEVRADAGDIGDLEEDCEFVADVDESPDCQYVLFVNSIQQFWIDEFARRGASYQSAVTTFFSDSIRTACGAASAQVGPFYCPADRGVYLDLGFFDVLRTQYDADTGAFGEGYVLAHEYGHHIQNLTGQMQNLRPGSGPESDAVRLELQADCYAGVWAHHATRPSPSGEVLILELSDQDIADGLGAAEAVGDDYIQAHFQGSVAPELWTHGSSAQRMRWFNAGFVSGVLENCDTFSAGRL
jgi:predicted metalloprotease